MAGALVVGPPAAVGQTQLREAGQRVLRPSIGFGDDVHYGLDVGIRVTSNVQLVASGQRWEGLKRFCTSYCGPQETGWSLGGGARFELSSPASRWWPFLHMDTGAQWFDGSAPGFPSQSGSSAGGEAWA